jgi:Terminase small subunit
MPGRKRYKTEKAPRKPKSEKEKARKHRRTKPRPADKPLTEKQSRFAAAFMKKRSLREAALIAGYSPLNPSQSGLQALKAIKKATPEVMDEMGLTIKTIIERHLIPLLNATEVKLAQNGGEYTDFVEVEALGTRTQATRMAFELQNAFPHEQSDIERRGGIDVLVLDIPWPRWDEDPVDVPAKPMPRLKEPSKDEKSE